MGASRRPDLSRENVLFKALELADTEGIAALSIRSLAQSMGTKPMSLYYYVANKDQILDGLVDLVFGEIHTPTAGGAWKEEMRTRAHSAREVLRRHPWAVGLLESRKAPGPATLKHHEATLATLRAAGFTVQQTARAYSLLDSYIYGFALQEAALPIAGAEPMADVAAPIMERFATGEYPHMVEIATEVVMQPGYDYGNEFAHGLELILGALEPVQ
ncbi:TetR/AcrR family transcriptional regulator [Paenarthrobacter sp. NPDC058040]|uniref:TetR/AcrR family transcriptional regulator n=1 Tax=unclassified Paenarthrobacter TaxID=2634190 RepID=UPI0036DE136A